MENEFCPIVLLTFCIHASFFNFDAFVIEYGCHSFFFFLISRIFVLKIGLIPSILGYFYLLVQPLEASYSGINKL